MKLFQRLLVAPAALGLVSPMAVSAADLNLDGVKSYASEEQVTSIDQFSDVRPTDWAYQALSNLIERYGCVAGYPDGTYRGQRAMTRYEAAALLNACLDRISEVTDELKRLMKEFEKELAVLRGRVDGLEAKVGELEATQFSTTTKLKGTATFVIGANTYSGDARSGNFDFDNLFEDGDIVDLANEIDDIVRDDFEDIDLGDRFESIDDLDGDTIRGLLALGGLGFGDLGSDVIASVISNPRFGDDALGRLEEVFGDDLNNVLVDIADLPRGDDFIKAVLLDYYTGGRVLPGQKLASRAARFQGGTVFNYDLKLDLDTSFTGKDLLRTRLRAGNFQESPFFGTPIVGLTSMEVAFGSDDDVKVDRLFYQFPIGSSFTATIGGRVRQDDMLAVWPSAYPADTVLDIFTYAGAPGAYSLNLGSGGGLWWKSGGFSISANYVSNNGNIGSPNRFEDSCGGIGTDCSGSTGTAQIAYTGSNWGIAGVYTYTQSENGAGLYAGNGTPLAVIGFELADNVNSYGVSAYWQPSNSGWIPSISGGWGLNDHSSDTFDFIDGATTQSWYVGLQWDDVFLKGNSFGMAVGQPTFLTDSGDEDVLGADDGQYAWEWWYKWQVTDNISVTPALYYLSVPMGQLTKGAGDDFDNFGGLVKTTFKF